MIVHDVGEMVRGEAVRLDQHLVVYAGVLEDDLAANEVADARLAVLRYGEADDVRRSGGEFLLHLRFRETLARAVVADELLPRALLLPQRSQAFRRAETTVRRALFDQLTSVPGVDRRPLRLAIGAVRPADVRPLVPFQPQPAQRLENLSLGFGVGALAVGILNSQNELAPMCLREHIVEKADVGRSDVRVAGRARRDADAYGTLCGAVHGVSVLSVGFCVETVPRLEDL